jgi:hypothetical protein
MCWIALTVGSAMSIGGTVLIALFYLGHGENRPEVASAGRVESLILGVMLVSVGALSVMLGATGAICRWLELV